MSVTVGSLGYVSTLDNSDFQAKSLQDIQLIRLRLQLTGDDSGIKKYDAAYKAAAEEQAALQKQLNAILEETKVKIADVAAAQAKPVSKTIVSDSRAEVELYKQGLVGLSEVNEAAAVTVEDLRARLAGVQSAIIELNALNEKGTVSTEVYSSAIANLTQNEIRLKAAIDSATASEIVETETRIKAAASIQTEIGLIENLKIELDKLKAAKITIVDPAQLARQNALIQETEAELKRLNNVGKVGFDAQGVAIKNTTAKVDPFSRAISRATSLSQIGATVVSRLTRQIIGLGVGLLSFYIGAKAIEALINYIKNLDVFSGRLDQLKHNLEAYNEVQKEANQQSTKQTTNLRILYNTATDVNVAYDDRIKAAKELKKEFPDEFANSSALAIINGKLKSSYDDLTKTIIEQARAQSVLSKIQEIEAKRADIAFQRDKNNSAKFSEISKVKGIISGGSGGTGGAGGIITEDQQRNNIKARTDIANKTLEENDKILKGQEDFLIKYAGGDKKLADIIEGGNDLIKDPLKRFNDIIKNASSSDDLKNLQKSLQAKLNSLAPDDKDISVYQEKIRQVEKLLKAYSPKVDDNKSALNAEKQSLKERLDLLNKVNDALVNTRRESLSEDQQALTQISDRFSKLKRDIEAYNINPKNKKNVIGANVFEEINNSERAAQINQANENENKYIQQDIDKKKKLYEDYEQYRTKVGSDVADKEYQDLLRSGKNFKDYLSNQQKAIDQADVSGAIKERIEIIKKYFDDLTQEQKVQLENLLIQYATDAQKRQAIIATSLDNEKKLRSAGADKQADQARKETQEVLTALDVDSFKKLDAYKSLFDGIDYLSTKQAKVALDKLKKYLNDNKSNLTPEAVKIIQRLINDTSNNINNDFPEGLKKVASGFEEISSSVSDFDSNLSSALSTISKVISGVANIKSNINSIKAPGADIFSKITGGLGIVSSAIGVFSAIGGLFSNSKEKAEQLQYAQGLQLKQTEAINKSLERQLALNKELYGTQRLTAYQKSLTDIKDAQDKALASLNGRLSLSGNKTLDEKYIDGFNNNGNVNAFLGTVIDQLKAKGIIVDLSTQSLEQLQVLLDSGKLDERTGAIVQQLVDLKEQYTDTFNTIRAETIGSTFESQLDNIVSLFENATTTAEDFANNFQKIIQQSIINSFKRQFLEKQLQGFYEQFSAFTDPKTSGGALNASEINQLQILYNQIIEKAKINFDQLQQATGIVFGNDTSSNQNSLQGSIKASLTEDTGTVLAGVFKGVQLNTYQTNQLLKDQNLSFSQLLAIAQTTLNVAIQIEINTRKTADNSDALPPMLEEIKGINKNTNGSYSIAARAAGINA